jgi:hypothetical protein
MLVFRNEMFPRCCHADIVGMAQYEFPYKVFGVEVEYSIVENMVCAHGIVLYTYGGMPIERVYLLPGRTCEYADLYVPVRSAGKCCRYAKQDCKKKQYTFHSGAKLIKINGFYRCVG